MSLSVEQINKLESENERLTKEVKQWQYEYEMLDACCELYSAKVQGLKKEIERLTKEIKTFEDKLQLRMASDKESDEFWDDIFNEKDYPFNKENAYKELRDYYFVLEQLPKIYMEITGGTLSKTTYFASSVIEAYNDSLDRYYDRIDNLEYNNNAYKTCLAEIKEIAIGIKNATYQFGQEADRKFFDNTLGKILQKIAECEVE